MAEAHPLGTAQYLRASTRLGNFIFRDQMTGRSGIYRSLKIQISIRNINYLNVKKKLTKNFFVSFIWPFGLNLGQYFHPSRETVSKSHVYEGLPCCHECYLTCSRDTRIPKKKAVCPPPLKSSENSSAPPLVDK